MDLVLVMPTFRRFSLLKRSVASILNQTDPDWKLHIVHDGPADPRLLRQVQRLDPRIRAWAVDRHWADWGLTPRLAALEHVNNDAYVAFWDDDNWYPPHAVAEIRRALIKTGKPAFVLLPSRLLHTVKPPVRLPLDQLRRGDVDHSMIVCRASVARRFLPLLKGRTEGIGEDYALFRRVLESGLGVERWQGREVCRYDGARTLAPLAYRSRLLLHLWGGIKHRARLWKERRRPTGVH